MSLLAGFIAAETYEAYAVFVAHALTAPSVFIFNPFTGRHLLPGQVGSLGESFSWNGVIPLFIGTMLAFALAWILAREAAGHYAAARPPLSKAIRIGSLDAHQKRVELR